MHTEGFRHAVEFLRQDHIPSAARTGEPPKHSTVRRLPVPIDRDLLITQSEHLGGSAREQTAAKT